MGSIGARKALRVIENVEKIIGIELFYAAQAMDFHAPLKSGKVMTAIHEHVRTKITPVVNDRVMTEDMEAAIDLIQSGDLIKIANELAIKEGLPFETKWSRIFDY
jgi:histidine ammonia-lyase